MDTPICDYVKKYSESYYSRLHMPGHKGKNMIGPENIDITEIEGADTLFHADGIIKKSEETTDIIAAKKFFTLSIDGTNIEFEEIGESLVNNGLQITATDMDSSGNQTARPLVVNGAPVFITNTIVENVNISQTEVSSWGLKFSQPICGCEYARALGKIKSTTTSGSG